MPDALGATTHDQAKSCKSSGTRSGEQLRKEHEKHKEPREPSLGVKGVLKLNMPNDAQEKHHLQWRVNAPPKQLKSQVCKGRGTHAAAKVRACV